MRYGGHTSCVAIARDGHSPSLVIDAGTGIRSVSSLLDQRPFRGAILLGHLHWDHTQGLPFFRSGNDPSAHVELCGPAQVGPDGKVEDFEAVLSKAMAPPFFPITPGQLRGEWRFAGLEEGEHEIAGFSVRALEIPHTGGRTFGFRISDGRSALAYMSDHYPLQLGPGEDGLGLRHPAALALADRTDLMLHDAQYLDQELPERAYFGHSSAGYAVGLARAAGVRHLLFYHHDPDRTDEEIDAIVSDYQALAHSQAHSHAEERVLIDEHGHADHTHHADGGQDGYASNGGRNLRVSAAAQGDVYDLGGP